MPSISIFVSEDLENWRKLVTKKDLGDSWRPLYNGSWQFVPIVSLEDKIVFGMGSGITKGGLGIYYPNEDE